MTPSCFHCCRSASVGKPLKTASSGVHIIPNPQLKRVPKRVTQKSAKGRERRRVQRRRSLVATVPVHRPTTVETHVWIPDQGGRHDSSAEYPGKYTHCTSFRLGNQPKALVSSMRSGDILPRAEKRVGLECSQPQSGPKVALQRAVEKLCAAQRGPGLDSCCSTVLPNCGSFGVSTAMTPKPFRVTILVTT